MAKLGFDLPICPQLPKSCFNTRQRHEKESCTFSCVRHFKKYPVMAALVPGKSLTTNMIRWLGLTVTGLEMQMLGDRPVPDPTPAGASNVALSSAEAELNAAVKGLSKLIGLNNLISETMHVKPTLTLCTDASAWKGMIPRHWTGKVKHLSVEQLWSHEVVRFYDIQVRKVTCASNLARHVDAQCGLCDC